MAFKFSAIWLCGACILMFVLQITISGFTDSLQLTGEAYVQVWRFVTAIFLHAGIGHLAYNLLALAMFGLLLENVIGTKRFLFLFFVSGILANVIAGFFYTASLGASGAIFGVIGCLIVLRPKMGVFAFGLPMPLFIAGILWVAGDLFGAVTFLTGNPLDNTGNIAHLSGVFIGMFLGFLFRKKFEEAPKLKSNVYLDESGMRQWEDRYMR